MAAEGKMAVKQERVTNMTEGRPMRLILAFALPLMVGSVFQQLYTVVDTAVVGQVLGVNALAAIGAADWTNWLMLGTIQGLAQGFAIQMAQDFGAGEYRRMNKVIGNSAVLSLLSSVVLLVVGQLMIRPLLTLLQTPDTIIDLTVTYLRILFAGVPIVMAYNLLASILRSLGDSQTPLRAMILASLINVALDLLFVVGCGWGVAGAAAATVIAQAFSSLYCLRGLRRVSILKLERSDLRLDPALDARLMRLGLPMAFMSDVIAVGGMILQFVVNGFGVIFIAGFTAANKLYGILEMAAISYGYAMVTYMGQNLGAGRIDRLGSGMRAAICTAVATSLVISLVMLLFGRAFLSLFISGSAEEVEQTMAIAYHYLAIMSAFLPVLYILHVTRSSLQGLGDMLFPTISSFAEFFMRTAAALVLPYFMGEEGVFYAEILAWTGADVVLIIGYLYRIRKIRSGAAAAD